MCKVATYDPINFTIHHSVNRRRRFMTTLQPAMLPPARWNETLVTAPARLHLGLLNMSGLFDRMDGGVGVSITEPRWQLRVKAADAIRVLGLRGELHDAATRALQALCDEFSIPGIYIFVEQDVPAHVGLGSKTSLLMALGRAVCQLAGNNFDVTHIAMVVGRGGTSGAGVNLARCGGVVWDSGHRLSAKDGTFGPSSTSAARPPQAVTRLAPSDLFAVHFRYYPVGPSGSAERKIFADTCPVPRDETTRLLLLASGVVLPCMAEAAYGVDLQAALTEMQYLGLKRAEWDAQDDVTLRFRKHWETSGVDVALCLSSMGPTMFVLTPDLTGVRQAISGFDQDPVHYTEARVSDSGIAVATH